MSLNIPPPIGDGMLIDPVIDAVLQAGGLGVAWQRTVGDLEPVEETLFDQLSADVVLGRRLGRASPPQ